MGTCSHPTEIVWCLTHTARLDQPMEACVWSVTRGSGWTKECVRKWPCTATNTAPVQVCARTATPGTHSTTRLPPALSPHDHTHILYFIITNHYYYTICIIGSIINYSHIHTIIMLLIFNFYFPIRFTPLNLILSYAIPHFLAIWLITMEQAQLSTWLISLLFSMVFYYVSTIFLLYTFILLSLYHH